MISAFTAASCRPAKPRGGHRHRWIIPNPRCFPVPILFRTIGRAAHRVGIDQRRLWEEAERIEHGGMIVPLRKRRRLDRGVDAVLRVRFGKIRDHLVSRRPARPGRAARAIAAPRSAPSANANTPAVAQFGSSPACMMAQAASA